jgi:hypothetical protein
VEAITARNGDLEMRRRRKWASAQAVRNVCVKPLDDVKPFDLPGDHMRRGLSRGAGAIDQALAEEIGEVARYPNATLSTRLNATAIHPSALKGPASVPQTASSTPTP